MKINELIYEGLWDKIKKTAKSSYDQYKESQVPEFVKRIRDSTSNNHYIKFTGDSMSFAGGEYDLDQLYDALEEVKILRQTTQIEKNDISQQLRNIRSEYSGRVANRGAMIPGGGKIGTALRFGVRSSRAAARGAHANIVNKYKTSVEFLNTLLNATQKIEVRIKQTIIEEKKKLKKSNSNKNKKTVSKTDKEFNELLDMIKNMSPEEKADLLTQIDNLLSA